ncbi:glutamyl-tRNA reductase [Galactobacter sp.]|uniref:glutamyl-tRNA reductase n=1 Tax=Galactobacter sp. TaxID=2676125 RepID=UPI0025BC2FAA|nr:glutamyl-tRNA reductase [Galactobacter sp.]
MSLIASHAELDLETVARLSAASNVLSHRRLPGVAGTVVVSTCNRFEVYAELHDGADADATRAGFVDSVASTADLPPAIVSRALTTLTDHDAVRHLFSVASGLDSAVVGEREIAGQIRRSLTDAQRAGTVTGRLSKLFQTASRTAKAVQSNTTLGSRGKSIVSVALDLATDLEPGPWASREVVLFGTGAYAGATLSLLQERGTGRIGVYSASGRAEAFTASRTGDALTDRDLADRLATADVIIGCSGGSQRLDAEDLAELDRGGKPLVAIDLALSRDFAPELDTVDGVTLLTLESVRMAAPREQVESVRTARHIVDEAAQDFAKAHRQRGADAAIVALRKHTQSVLESEIEKVRAQHGCTAAAEEVEFAMRRMVKQLLHTPMVRAREAAAAGNLDDFTAGLDALYGIDLSSDASAPQPSATEPTPSGRPGATGAVCPISADHERSA